jgi:superfamily II DNA/RNA helicase
MSNLPTKVQTLLYSATIGKQIKDLARTKLKRDHEYIQIHDFE